MKSFLAAVMMFTRIPLWRIVQVDKKHYTGILLYWPVVGFLTGLTTWGVLRLTTPYVPALVACVLAVIARILLTGALHEDGFGDFCDGFGGGHGKESILRIMKDSHIGGYGVMGLILYFLLYVSLLYELRQPHGCLYIYEYVPLGIILGADVSAKLCTSVLMNALPYARTEEESKVKVLYRKIRFPEYLLIGLPILALLWMLEAPFLPLVPTGFAVLLTGGYLKHKIGGYTGDCCGATVLIAEIVFYLTALILLQNPVI
jgi:adenosylcobinamide-GDP ribazoletransferase